MNTTISSDTTQNSDYRVIERECEKLEQKYNLIIPENRISRDIDALDQRKDLSPKDKKGIISEKYKNKHPSSKERMLDVRGIISNKQQMKDALNTYLYNASSPSDFINQITENGFNVIHNGKSSFSIQHEDQIFKASELGLSYKTLKAKLGDDTGFEQTLKNKHNVKKYEDCSITSNEEEPVYMKKIKPNSVLATKFKFIQYNDKVEYFYNSASSKKSFEYYKDPSKVLFNDTSRQSAKAGIQRLVADAKPPQSFTVNGPDYFKKNVWLEFQLMGLEAKGFKLEGYKPTPADLEELKKIQEQYASMNKKPEPKPAAPALAVEAPKPVEPVIPIPVDNAPERSTEPASQVDQHKVAATNDDLIDELMREFETADHKPVAEAPTKALETPEPVEPAVDNLYTPMAPEPLSEPENHKIVGDYSTYDTSELCDEMADIVSRIDRKHFIGNSSNDIAGHRKWDATHRDYVHLKPANERKQYHLRQELYDVHDEIKNRNPKLANELDNEFKKSMKYNTRFKPEIQIQADKK